MVTQTDKIKAKEIWKQVTECGVNFNGEMINTDLLFSTKWIFIYVVPYWICIYTYKLFFP